MREPLLQVDGINAYYGDFQALFGVSLKVEPGQVVAVIGANGAGKSTLLRSISGLMHPRRGEIAFDGERIGTKPAFAMRQARHRHGAGRAPAVSFALGRREPTDRRTVETAGPVEPATHLRPVSGAGRAASSAGPDALRRPAADGCDRARADVEPAAAAHATRSASGSRPSSCATSTRNCRRSWQRASL